MYLIDIFFLFVLFHNLRLGARPPLIASEYTVGIRRLAENNNTIFMT